MVEGHAWREDQAWRKLAWQTAIIINHWRKENAQVTADDLLPDLQETKEVKVPMTDEQMAENALAWAIFLGAEDRREVH